jgi:hypothetical protein
MCQIVLAVVIFLFNVHAAHAQAGSTYPGISNGLQRFYSSDGGYSQFGCQISTCTAANCNPNQYLFDCGGKKSGTCEPCTNTKPAFSDWKVGTNGGFSANGCQWQCQANYKLNSGGTGCELQACADQGKTAPDNAGFEIGQNGQAPNCFYKCNAGYIAAGTPNARGPERCEPCGAGQTSTYGAASCSDCGPGLFSPLAGSAACSECVSSERKYSTGTKNVACLSCSTCLAGEFRTGCGGSLGPGTCGACSNTNYP